MKTLNSIQQVKVSDVMSDQVKTLTAANTVREAVDLMLEWKLTTIPIVDGQGHCVGIVSNSDLTEMFVLEDSELAHVLDTDRFSMDWLNRSLDTSDVTQIQEVMTFDVVTIGLDATLPEACEKMAIHQIHHLPVVDSSNLVVGILSTFDVVKTVSAAK